MFTLPDLPYDFKALEPFIDEETMHLHHDKHHAGYVKNLNDALSTHPELEEMQVSELLEHLDEVPEDIRKKVRNNAGGHFNHTMFWEIMKPNPKGDENLPSEKLYEAINKQFGSFGDFKLKFTDAALGRFGSGWAWLNAYDGGLCIATTANQDNPLMKAVECDCDKSCKCGNKCFPILGLDVWEHAYYLKYKNMRKDYIDAWWNVVNWGKVSENFNKA